MYAMKEEPFDECSYSHIVNILDSALTRGTYDAEYLGEIPEPPHSASNPARTALHSLESASSRQ